MSSQYFYWQWLNHIDMNPSKAFNFFMFFEICFVIIFSQDVLEEYAERVKRRGAVVKIDPAHLRWTPFVPPAPTTSS